MAKKKRTININADIPSIEDTQKAIEDIEGKTTDTSKRGPGRPKKHHGRKRTTFIIDPIIVRALKAKASEHGWTASDLLNSILSQHPSLKDKIKEIREREGIK